MLALVVVTVLLAVLVVGLVVFLAAVLRHGRRGRAWSARQRIGLQLPLTPQEVHRRTVAALGEVGARVSEDRPGCVRARLPISWTTYGAVLTVSWTPAPAGVDVVLQSRPRLRTSGVDYGHARRRLDRMVSLIARP